MHKNHKRRMGVLQEDREGRGEKKGGRTADYTDERG